MKTISGIDQPPEGAISSHNTSRRTFLKGVGWASAAGLAAPLLASTSARAGGGPLVLGIQGPEPWEGETTTPVLAAPGTWSYKVPGAVGCRSYRDNPFTDPNECPFPFPGVTSVPDGMGSQKPLATKVVASIRPDPLVLLNPNHPNQPAFDNHIKDLIKDGMTQAGASSLISPQLTVWHEAGNLYTSLDEQVPGPSGKTWKDYGVVPGTQTTINGVVLSADQIVRSMHVKMQSLCNQVAANNPGLPRVEYGAIIYGEISKMDPYVPYDPYSLDWYGIDVYYEDDADWGRGDLVDYAAVSNYMNNFLNNLVRPRNITNQVNNPKINICECNANASNADARPGFFENLAAWLNAYPGGRRMLTFFPVGGGPHSVTWGPPQQSTIDALNFIQSTYG